MPHDRWKKFINHFMYRYVFFFGVRKIWHLLTVVSTFQMRQDHHRKIKQIF